MKLLPTYTYFFLISWSIPFSSSEKCVSSKILNINSVDNKWICSASSSIKGMECQNLFDKDSHSFWHPGSKGDGARLNLHLNKELILVGLKVYQQDWESGYASEITVFMGNDTIRIKSNDKRTFIWKGAISGKQISGQLLTIEVNKVVGGAMGAFSSLQLVGCQADQGRDVGTTGASGSVKSAKGEFSATSTAQVSSARTVTVALWGGLASIVIIFVVVLAFSLWRNKKKYHLTEPEGIWPPPPPLSIIAQSEAGSISNLSEISRVSRVSRGSRVSRSSRRSRRSSNAEKSLGKRRRSSWKYYIGQLTLKHRQSYSGAVAGQDMDTLPKQSYTQMKAEW